MSRLALPDGVRSMRRRDHEAFASVREQLADPSVGTLAERSWAAAWHSIFYPYPRTRIVRAGSSAAHRALLPAPPVCSGEAAFDAWAGTGGFSHGAVRTVLRPWPWAGLLASRRQYGRPKRLLGADDLLLVEDSDPTVARTAAAWLGCADDQHCPAGPLLADPLILVADAQQNPFRGSRRTIDVLMLIAQQGSPHRTGRGS